MLGGVFFQNHNSQLGKLEYPRDRKDDQSARVWAITGEYIARRGLDIEYFNDYSLGLIH